MTVSLYDFSVASFDITLGAVSAVLAKGRAFCEAEGLSLSDITATCLRDDMRPFRFQIVSVCHHSLGAMRGVEAGEFGPPGPSDRDYEGLQALVEETREGLKAYTPEIVEGFAGKDVVFRLGDQSMPFIAEDFLMSFSKPNFYFHAATAYDILRIQGAPLGKRDFLGQIRLKG